MEDLALLQELIDNWTIEHDIPIEALRKDAIACVLDLSPQMRREKIAWLVGKRLSGHPETPTGLVSLRCKKT